MTASKIVRPIAAALLLLLATAAHAQAPAKNPPRVETRNGLVINGETIADAKLLADAKAEGSIVLYTSAGEDYERHFTDLFKQQTGVEVKMVRLVVNRLTERILSENGAGKLAADVIRMSDAPAIKTLQDAGVYQPYKAPFDASLDASAKVSDGSLFYRYSSSVYTVGYNNELVKGADIPKSWKELLNPKWKGRIGIVSVDAGGSSAALARFMQSKLGADYLKQYAAQGPRIYTSAAGLLTSMARGEILVGHVIPARVGVARESGAPVSFVVPEEGMSGWDFYMGITKSSKKVAAKLFVNWVMSKYGQQILSELGDYPSRADVQPPTVMGISLPALNRVFRMSVEESTKTQAPDREVWYQTFRQK